MKVLITGSASLLGKSLSETVPDGIQTLFTYHSFCPLPAAWMDITDEHSVNNVFEIYKPSAVIHCAGEGDVDRSENDKLQADNINVEGTRNLVNACKKYDCGMVYISSNAIFDGKNPPYRETSPRLPVNYYGDTKMRAENLVVELQSWNIIRPILLYGWPFSMVGSRGNWATRLIEKLEKGEKVKVVDDTVTQPTYAPDLARVIWEIVLKERILNNIFHVAPQEAMSLYDFAIRVANEFELNGGLIERAKSSDFPSIAKRPKDTSYDVSKILDLGLKCISVDKGLKLMRESR